MSVLAPSNAFPGIPFPNHTSGKSHPQSFIYPGAVQVKSTLPEVLSWTNAFPGIPFPNHTSGQSTPQSFIYPGAVQRQVPTASMVFNQWFNFPATATFTVTMR
jgi:hypothetical protein